MEAPILPRIDHPALLRELSLNELKELSQEIRTRIIEVLAVNGGHLASNLGSVEMTLALHTVFDSPIDKFIFDVSHQTYTHKLITGRNDKRFDLIRKHKGLNGFCHPKESAHDQFFAGHAGTALSLALGMAKGRDLQGRQEHVIPIIGDATLTCGLSLEALNNIKRDLGKFIVILNDNAMSISHNVGGITNMLSRLMSNPTTSKWVHDLEALLSKIPCYGTSLAKQGQKIAKSIKNLVSSAPFFEHFGLSYIGPIDGHDLKKMIAVFQAIKDLPMPVLVHLYTKKGHGVALAENDPINYHGAKPFDPKTCEFLPSISSKPAFSKVFGDYLLEKGKKDSDFVVVTPAMSLGSGLDPFMKQFPDQCIDVGIAEGHAVTFCGGLAKDPKIQVFCAIYATFLQRALDNLFHDVCLQELPVVFAIDRAGLALADGATHHGIYDIVFLKAMPHLILCQPRNGDILRELLHSAFSWKKPVAIRYPNIATEVTKKALEYRPLGKGELLSQGDDLLIIALGTMCTRAFELQKALAGQGISAAIFDPIFIKPLDTDGLRKLFSKHTRIVTLEEHALKGGFGAEIVDFASTMPGVEVLTFGIPDDFFDQGSYADLFAEMGLTIEVMALKIQTHFSLQLVEEQL